MNIKKNHIVIGIMAVIALWPLVVTLHSAFASDPLTAMQEERNDLERQKMPLLEEISEINDRLFELDAEIEDFLSGAKS